MAEPQVLLVAFPAQGHINPSLQFAKKLIANGVRVTFMTTVNASHRLGDTTSPPQGLTFATFSDAYDQGFDYKNEDPKVHMVEIKRTGSRTLKEFIAARADEGTRFSLIVYSNLLPWVATVAREFQIPATLFWNQPASIFSIYFHYFRGGHEQDIIENGIKEPSFGIELPGLPLLACQDLPSFFHPANPFVSAIPTYREHIEILDQETKPRVLVNTFEALEAEAIQAVDKCNLVGIGPLMPSPLEGDDLFKVTKGKREMEWLNSKAERSVIYVSFGSISKVAKPQMEELAKGLLGSRRPFFWVIRMESGGDEEEEERITLSCQKELEKQGMLVTWCSQVEVLSHPSVGCFVTHSGWNSTLESLVTGVPMVTFPQWADQPTNAKLVQDVWKTGVKLTKNEHGIVEVSQIEKCLEMVMGGGERVEEIRRNAKIWKDLAKEATNQGGSSDNNLKAFVDELQNY